MKISTVAAALLTITTLHDTAGFLPSLQTGHRRVFGVGVFMSSTADSARPRIVNATDDLTSNPLVHVLNDPDFQGPIHEAEKKVLGGSIMLHLVSTCVHLCGMHVGRACDWFAHVSLFHISCQSL